MDNLTLAERLFLTFIPALATVIAAYLAINKFYAERLWEKKLDTCNRLFETLADLHGTLRDLDRCFRRDLTFENQDEVKRYLFTASAGA
ncbi:MAG: hypothetical protein EXQ58_13770 [Acidobacteria bacterium]|nr:hypothetical protein [Acidobacteriota bacterium]